MIECHRARLRRNHGALNCLFLPTPVHLVPLRRKLEDHFEVVVLGSRFEEQQIVILQARLNNDFLFLLTKLVAWDSIKSITELIISLLI